MRVVILALLLVSCKKESDYGGAFDLPIAAAVLHPEQNSPFEEPLGVVANGHYGQIVPLLLKQGRFVTDDPTVSFLRTNPIPTGRARLLSSVAIRATSPGDVRLYAGDRGFEHLIEVPWIIGTNDDGSPIEGDVTVSEPEGGGGATLADLEVKRGYTATEDWTVTFDGEVWEVVGSRSGRMAQDAVPGEPFVGDDRVVAFTITGDAETGSQFTFTTDNGLAEHDVGGIPLQLLMTPDGTRLWMIVQDEDVPVLRWFDPETLAVTDVPLADDALPTRLSIDEAGTLWVSDLGRPAVWSVSSDDVATEVVLPWPTFDVASLVSEVGTRLFVVPEDARSVWVYDVEDAAFADVNAMIPGVQGMPYRTPVRGVEAMPIPFEFPEQDASDVHGFGRAVAIAGQSGQFQFMQEETGCLVQTDDGPSTAESTSFGSLIDFGSNFDSITGGPFLEPNDHDGRHVLVNPCAGIARSESWTLLYSEALQAWRVIGSLSGEQVAMAREDVRYVSDEGAISFVVRAGVTPTGEGYELTFSIRDGALTANGDNDPDPGREVELEAPGDPVFFHYRVGPTVGGWKPVDDRPFVLAVAEAANLVGRVKPQEGTVEVTWQ